MSPRFARSTVSLLLPLGPDGGARLASPLAVGAVHSVPVLTHQQLISDPRALDQLEEALLRD